MITLTDSARDYLKSVSNGDYVTLGVKGGGCSGMQYVWDFAKNWPDVKWSDPIDDVLVLDPSTPRQSIHEQATMTGISL